MQLRSQTGRGTIGNSQTEHRTAVAKFLIAAIPLVCRVNYVAQLGILHSNHVHKGLLFRQLSHRSTRSYNMKAALPCRVSVLHLPPLFVFTRHLYSVARKALYADIDLLRWRSF